MPGLDVSPEPSVVSRSNLVIVLLGVAGASALLVSGGMLMTSFPRLAEGLAFVPATIIVVVVVLLYGRIRRSELQERLAVRAAELTTEAAQARARAAELASLVRFSQALNFCTDAEALRHTVLEELPRLVGQQRFWLRTRSSGSDLVVSHSNTTDSIPAEPEAWETFPLVAGGRHVGVLGVRQDPGPLTEAQRRTLELAALMLAVTVRNVQLFKRISDFSLFDPLTACLTRQQGLEMFTAEIRRAQRAQAPVSALLMDVDHYDQVLDQFGQAVGDQILARLGRLFKGELRASDLRCRYSTAQFAFMLPDTGVDGAARAANDLRQKVADMIVTAEGERLPVTVSIGIAGALPSDTDPILVLKRAEAGLVKAVREGRNRAVVGEQPAAGQFARR